jgi:hypothetical protein
MTEDPGCPHHHTGDLAELRGLMEAKGEATFGERITMMAHALQCAALARADGPVLRPRHRLSAAPTDRRRGRSPPAPQPGQADATPSSSGQRPRRWDPRSSWV